MASPINNFREKPRHGDRESVSLGSEKSGGVSLTINICLESASIQLPPSLRLIPERGGGWRGFSWDDVAIDRGGRRPGIDSVPVYPVKTRERTEFPEENLKRKRNSGKKEGSRRDDRRGTAGVVGQMLTVQSSRPCTMVVGRMRDENNGGRVLNL